MSDASDTRRTVYLLLTAVAVAAAAARVFGAENVFEPSRYTPPADGYTANAPDPPRVWPATRPDPTPMFSSNDRSRFATIRALVDEGTYAIGRRVYADGANPKQFRDEGIVAESQYKSLDIVLRPLGEGATGPQTREFYSSKPPLMPTLLAGEYWLIKKVFGLDIVRDRFVVMPLIVFTVNVLPFAVYLVLLARLVEGAGKTDFGRILAFTTGAVGTFLVTFSGTLNNHSPAAFCVLFAVYPLVRAFQEKRDMTPAGYLCCGFFASFAATFDLPAASLLAALGLPLLVARTRNTLLFFVPGAILPLLALLACNAAAMGQLMPAYSEFGGPWYNFEGSHWAKRGTPLAKGIDFNEEPTAVYAFHLLLGHHGWFSLTPVWFLGLAGLVALGIRSAADVRKMFAKPAGTGWTPEVFAAMTLVVSATVFAFYLTRTQSYNYGGNTSGPRWLFWLIPLWVLAVPPAADRLASSRGGRGLCAVLLALSVFAAFYPAVNPWRNPWVLSLLEYTGIKRY
ncbi:Uncharacterized protein OS=Planctomyces maris DSM 8797 GN=PM8797T_23539 PE=4 SV=1 [Gemmataceae bacterium]|nr:Uncharacterized protein OS=Planctomyces maris DSM 8797 GN=PM8797T_23539 PE=4 SV=1 [Gemmataceae bacterium]VTT96375.1 Uncharacterized protein OS=Planctomyces maris DSM 8797 GN=PM8797T_23539 PE=4 SV=1 [Gemmataceae bacterium]